MKSKLNVFVNQLKAGELWLDQQRRFCFQYDKSWIKSPVSYRLSVSLPLREDPYLADGSYSYFTNLLPEGKILNVISRKLQIPVSNQFGLLKAVGGDCAGAVSLFEDGDLPPKPEEYPYTKKMAMKIGGGRHFQFLEPKHGESPVLKEISDVIKNSPKEKLKAFQ